MNSMVSFSLQNEHQCLLHSLKIQCSLQLLAPTEPPLLPPPSVRLVEEDTHGNDIAAPWPSDNCDMVGIVK